MHDLRVWDHGVCMKQEIERRGHFQASAPPVLREKLDELGSLAAIGGTTALAFAAILALAAIVAGFAAALALAIVLALARMLRGLIRGVLQSGLHGLDGRSVG